MFDDFVVVEVCCGGDFGNDFWFVDVVLVDLDGVEEIVD